MINSAPACFFLKKRKEKKDLLTPCSLTSNASTAKCKRIHSAFASSDSRISFSVSSLGRPRTLSAVPTWASNQEITESSEQNWIHRCSASATYAMLIMLCTFLFVRHTKYKELLTSSLMNGSTDGCVSLSPPATHVISPWLTWTKMSFHRPSSVCCVDCNGRSRIIFIGCRGSPLCRWTRPVCSEIWSA